MSRWRCKNCGYIIDNRIHNEDNCINCGTFGYDEEYLELNPDQTEILWLKQTIEGLKKDVSSLCNRMTFFKEDYKKHLKRKDYIINKMLEGIRFYADDDNWHITSYDDGFPEEHMIITAKDEHKYGRKEKVGGKLASEILNSIEDELI